LGPYPWVCIFPDTSVCRSNVYERQLSSKMLSDCSIFQENLGTGRRQQIQAKGALMDYQPVENHGVVGNMRSVARISV
jgi:hypothetical protein